MADPPAWGFPDLTPTARWVLGHGLPTSIRAPVAPLGDTAWRALVGACSAHRLGGHLIAAVVDGTLPTTPAQRVETARLELEATRTRIRYDEVCRPVLEALAEARIPVRLLKGSALPWSDYPSPQLRPTADLDILVPGRRLHDAVEVLGAAGGRIVNPEPTDRYALEVFKGLTVAMPSGLEVDLHRILSWGPLGVRVPEVDLWAPARHFDRLGRTAETLDVDRTLVHVCAHLLLLGALRASEVRDVAQLAVTPDLQPDRVLSIARRWGHESVVAVALRMAERELRLLPEAHPLADWAFRFRPPIRDRIWLRTDRPDAPIRRVEPATVFIELPGWRPRVTLLRALFAPAPGTDPSFGVRVGGILRRAFARLPDATSRSHLRRGDVTLANSTHTREGHVGPT